MDSDTMAVSRNWGSFNGVRVPVKGLGFLLG